LCHYGGDKRNPLAFATAKQLGVPLMIARHNSEATDGPSVNINYVFWLIEEDSDNGSSHESSQRPFKASFIDDFMKGEVPPKA